ncbi:efflux RND transporter periplasmic adaptor subunit [Salmonella enterica subsp. enterica serovar Typhimurium]|uniref:AcrA n=4 Tax=Enterobacterales TaxID=91347 RepID=J7FN23_CITFR|nr:MULTISPECIES: efflux RND transporter periplasmic adaptor subunit [Enterobacteriaceae]AQT23502.1 AcrA [Leclercia adecarboxylata]EBI0102583.1 efflux RND transporter periplasmic adaptor subunit [Salmonella enterica subsp. enterica serovar Johannesburg]ECB6493475.1 efflux RND transporter periplasmic adaptor subunit [Salmonella enterica subsp. enterica serovar Typhimurium]ECC4320535.1 efflux RND transporter periplasmic adaptor subunit [Salmonella enterica]EKS9206009.1 efflux RND transporter peri
MPPLRSFALVTSLALMLSACDADNTDATSSPPVPEVGVVTVQPEAVALTTELPGRTTPYMIAEVRPQVGGILLKRNFEEGSEVEAGQPLYQIDPAPYRAALAKAEASLASAKRLSERYDLLIQKNAISQQERDDARSQYLQARATVDSARIDLGYTTIRSPISGRIGRSYVTQGALMTANQSTALATVQQLDPIYVDVVQPSTSLLRLKEDLASGRLKSIGGDQVEARLQLENGKPYAHAGKLQFSEVTVDPGTGAVTLRAVFPNPDGLLLPGMFVRTQLQEGIRSDALLVPQRGVTRDRSGQAIALVVGDDGVAQQREVIIERTVGTDWLISAGLNPGDKVIIDGVQNVRHGTKVVAVPATATAPVVGSTK